MKVQVLKAYYDIKLERKLEEGEVIEMTWERVKEIDKRLPGFIKEIGCVKTHPPNSKKGCKS